MGLLLQTVVILSAVACAWGLSCVPCDDVTCVPPAPGCELGRRVCSCCDECRLKEGQPCGAFTPECESELVCFTDLGVFLGRPGFDSRAKGTCIKFDDVPDSARSTHTP